MNTKKILVIIVILIDWYWTLETTYEDPFGHTFATNRIIYLQELVVKLIQIWTIWMFLVSFKRRDLALSNDGRDVEFGSIHGNLH